MSAAGNRTGHVIRCRLDPRAAARADVNLPKFANNWTGIRQPGQPSLERRSPEPPGTRTSPAAGRDDDISHRYGQGQAVLMSSHRSSNSVSLVLVRARRHQLQAEGCQSLPGPGRAGPRASLPLPASPRGSREHLDDLDAAAWPSELDLMAQLAGFGLEARHADWAGARIHRRVPVPRLGLPSPGVLAPRPQRDEPGRESMMVSRVGPCPRSSTLTCLRQNSEFST